MEDGFGVATLSLPAAIDDDTDVVDDDGNDDNDDNDDDDVAAAAVDCDDIGTVVDVVDFDIVSCGCLIKCRLNVAECSSSRCLASSTALRGEG